MHGFSGPGQNLFNLIPLPGLDGYGVIGPFLHPAIQMQMERVRAYAIWILILVFWYIPRVAQFFSLVVSLIAVTLGVDLYLAMQGRDYLTGYFADLLR